MKRVILSLALALTLGMNAQTANYQDVISKAKKGKLETYVSKSGDKFSVGDELYIGSSMRGENFDLILQNGGIEFYPLTNAASGSAVTIKKIVSRSRLVFVYTTKPNGFVFGLIVSNLEAALKNGEISNGEMSSDDALAELKKAKDKLDLGLITQEQYEAKKIELIPLIN